MTPLERAARAIWEIHGSPSKGRDIVVTMGNPDPEPDWQRYLPEARAALEAIREPSDGMKKAGAATLSTDNSIAGRLMDAESCWEDMIEAALGEVVVMPRVPG